MTYKKTIGDVKKAVASAKDVDGARRQAVTAQSVGVRVKRALDRLNKA